MYFQLYFNPRTREGCDKEQKKLEKQAKISIHAPAKGATLYLLQRHLFWQISIHAPAKGATSVCNFLEKTLHYFNPRTREGCDLTTRGVISG